VAEKVKLKFGTLSLLVVFTPDGELVGHGHLIWHDDHIHGPFLSNYFGKPLPEAWYQLKTMETFPTVWTDTVQ